jgi:predicted DNA-binding transcriptional regulator AlpA
MPKARNSTPPKNATVIYRKSTDPKKPPDDAELLTYCEAAWVLRVSYKTVWRYAKQPNKPPIVWAGKNSPRFPRKELIEWFSNKENTACIV